MGAVNYSKHSCVLLIVNFLQECTDKERKRRGRPDSEKKEKVKSQLFVSKSRNIVKLKV